MTGKNTPIADYRSYEGKTVLVTGGTGSIGSEIVRQLLLRRKGLVRVFSNDEDSLSSMRRDFDGRDDVRFLLGDVRDRQRLSRAMEGVHVVFHAAALKHVWACEHDPFEAVMTNVIGTKNIVETALEQNLERVVTISTDKAASPVSVLGATKLVAERLTISSGVYKGARKTVFCCVRFGNVLASRGSVIPIFQQQIQNGEPVAITDPDMTRFVMSIPQSVGLVLKAATLARGGEIFILKMPSVKLGDLAETMVALYSERGVRAVKPSIKRIGVRPGEKFHEDLMSPAEARHALETEDMFVLLSSDDEIDSRSLRRYPGASRSNSPQYASCDGIPLARKAIRELLKEYAR